MAGIDDGMHVTGVGVGDGGVADTITGAVAAAAVAGGSDLSAACLARGGHREREREREERQDKDKYGTTLQYKVPSREHSVRPEFTRPCTKGNPVLAGPDKFSCAKVLRIDRAYLDEVESCHIRTVSAAPRAYGKGRLY